MYKIYLDFSLALAKNAGDIIRNNFVMNMKKEWKSDNTPITETDLSINKLVIEKVKINFPDHSILGEEKSEIHPSHKYIWVCDPVDETIPFSHGIPNCTFSLALVEDGQPIVAVVYDPFMNRLFYASKGGGAYLNGNTIKVGSWNTLNNLLIGMEWWKGNNWDYSKISEYLTENSNCFVMKYNSVIYKGMLVASGEFGGVLFPGNNPWDMATIKLIVEEAGGKVTNLMGENDRYDIKGGCSGMVASSVLLHNELIKIVKSYGFKK